MERVPTLGVKQVFKETLRTKAGFAGFAMLGAILAVALVIPFIAPLDVVHTWTDINAWTDYPRNAAPEWVEIFAGKKLPRTVLLEKTEFRKAASDPNLTLKVILLRATFDFTYDDFPSEATMATYSNWTFRSPTIEITWQRPDDRNLTLTTYAPTRTDPVADVIPLSTDTAIKDTIRQWALALNATDSANVRPEVTLFAKANADMLLANRAEVLKGRYVLRVKVIAFDQADDVDARFIAFGKVYGLAGTDYRRRDLLIGLLWGAPVALAFGVSAALITVFANIIIGGAGAYFGGRWDEFIQRATDFLLIIPVLPVLILMGSLYRPGLVTILIVVVALSILGSPTKVVRSIVLQVKEEQYIEAAKSYGATRTRILMRHIIPRTLPYTFALVALSVPSFIFLEASLSFLGVGDPLLPTWGAIMGEAQREGALYNDLWWWISFPAIGILSVTVAFALIGYSFDKVLNPRLREE